MARKKANPCTDSEDQDAPIELNPILEKIGHLGRFQLSQIGLLYFVYINATIGVLTFAFTGYLPEYRCVVPQCENVTSATYYDKNITYADDWREEDLEFADYVQNAIKKPGFGQHECKRLTFDGPLDTCNDFNQRLLDNQTAVVEQCPKGEVVFDKKVVGSSFATDLEFVCDDFPLRGIFSSFIMGGMLIGSFVVGMISDKLGRKNAMLICIVVHWIAGIVGAFSPWRALYGICRILIGISAIGQFISEYVLVAEATLPSSTNLNAVLLSPAWTIGALTFGMVAYFIREKVALQLTLFVPSILLLIPWYFIKESPRWLIARGRYKEARDVIEYIARVNGKVVPSQTNQKAAPVPIETAKSDVSMAAIFRPRKILMRTLNSFFQWFCVTGTYYGLTFGSTSLVGDPYVNWAISNVAEIPTYLAALYVFDRLGRKRSLIICQLIAGVCCLITGSVIGDESQQSLQVAAVSIGKFCSSLSFSLVWLMAVEMFPTNSRSTALGTCSTIGRIGGVYALSLEGLQVYWQPLPFTLMGAKCVLSGLLAFFLPETTGGKLPETTQEAIDNVGKNYKLKSWCFKPQHKPANDIQM